MHSEIIPDKYESLSDDVVICKNVGVKFSTRNPTPTIADLWDSLLTSKKNREKRSYFWALKDVSFSVKRGEILGLIGKNGAGKSTLLRVVAQILKPDTGTIQVNTKCNLLRSGIGIREQLSGRENIILGCLYLGHSMKEIKEKYDEIVDFAELREHIERPLRYYSDGMNARLMFSIATSIKPDFLLMDELLGAGDIGFVSKAAKKMKEVIKSANGGIIATHDMSFILNSCAKALYLDKGEIRFYGDPKEAVEIYKKDSGL